MSYTEGPLNKSNSDHYC